MARAIALARTAQIEALELARIVLVAGCGVALIAAGRSLPF